MISYLLVVHQQRTQIVIHALLKCQQENLYHEQNVTHIFFFKQKTAYEIGLGIPAEPLFRSSRSRRKTNKRKSKHSAMLRNKETRHRMFIGLLNTTRKLA